MGFYNHFNAYTPARIYALAAWISAYSRG